MAEDEIRKHAKAAYKAFKDPEHSWQHKVKDILLEVAIIVFAVSISIWFHNLSDKRADERLEQAFLTGLKVDLKNDLDNMKQSKAFYRDVLNGMTYFSKIGSGGILNMDSLNKYNTIFFSSTTLQSHTSRYEALKGSGKLSIIEDQELLNQIISYNESTLSHINLLNTLYMQYIEKLATYIEQNGQLDKAGRITNAQDLLDKSEMRFLLSFGRGSISGNVIPAHDDGLQKCAALLKAIDKNLDN